MTDRTPIQLSAELRLARQHVHRSDAERAELEAKLLTARAQVLRADARTARVHAELVGLRHALEEVQRFCELTIKGSARVQAREHAFDTLQVIENADATVTREPDSAWHTVWLEGNWRHLTAQMTPGGREAAADAVDRHSAFLAAPASQHVSGEPTGLRWWRTEP